MTTNNNNNQADLLGLSTPPAQVPAGPASTLIDVLGDLYTGTGAAPPTANGLNPRKYVKKFIFELAYLNLFL